SASRLSRSFSREPKRLVHAERETEDRAGDRRHGSGSPPTVEAEADQSRHRESQGDGRDPRRRLDPDSERRALIPFFDHTTPPPDLASTIPADPRRPHESAKSKKKPGKTRYAGGSRGCVTTVGVPLFIMGNPPMSTPQQPSSRIFSQSP